MFDMKNPSRWIFLMKLSAIFVATMTALIFIPSTSRDILRYQMDSSHIFLSKRTISKAGAISPPTNVSKAGDKGLLDTALFNTIERANTNYSQRESNLNAINLKNYLPNAYLYPHLAKPYNQSVLAFMYDSKIGGNSMKRCIKRLHRAMHKQEPILLVKENVTEESEKLLNQVKPPNDYYIGDLTLGICNFFDDRPCSYFTLVREPYERMISNYYICKNGGDGCPQNVTTIEEFTMSLCGLFFRQLTTRVFCKEHTQNTSLLWKCERETKSIEHLSPNQEKEALLKYLLENIDKIFAVIGLSEEYENSLKLFENAFGEPFHGVCYKTHTNYGSYKTRDLTDVTEVVRKSMISETKEMLMENEQIRQCLHEDVQLYDKMFSIFQKQKQVFFSMPVGGHFQV